MFSDDDLIQSYTRADALRDGVLIDVSTVAREAGISLPEAKLVEAAFRLGEAMREATSSTAHDVQRGKCTEIDSLNGYVARRGAELAVPTPVNQTLHALVKLLEEAM